jgi:hypothetical protein
MSVVSRLACVGLVIGVTCPAFAGEVKGSWDFPEQSGWAKPQELVFTVASFGKLTVLAEIRPYCECGRGGFGYVQLEHRAAGKSEWKPNLPKGLSIIDHSHRPAPWMDGQPATDVFELHAEAGAAQYEFRVVVRANARWASGGYTTPAQTIAVTISGEHVAGVAGASEAASPAPTPAAS